MTSNPNRLDRQLAEAVLRRSATDREFRRLLLTEPRRAIREALGQDLGLGITVQFVERPPGVDAMVVLPDFEGD